MKILLADDHPLFREGVKPILENLEDQVWVYEAYDFESAFAIAANTPELDLALLDLNMPGIDGKLPIAAVKMFRTTYPVIPVVVLSAAENPEEIQSLLSSGVLGYITKASHSGIIRSALQLVLAGGVYIPPEVHVAGYGLPVAPRRNGAQPQPQRLSPRQIEVLRALAKGYSNRKIADELSISEGTIKVHLSTIFRLLDVNTRTEALVAAKKLGIDV